MTDFQDLKEDTLSAEQVRALLTAFEQALNRWGETDNMGDHLSMVYAEAALEEAALPLARSYLALHARLAAAEARAGAAEGELGRVKEGVRELVDLDTRHRAFLEQNPFVPARGEFEKFAAEFDAMYGRLAALAAAPAPGGDQGGEG